MVRLVVLKDSKAVSKKVALIIKQAIDKKPDLVLGLATGDTMDPIYEELVNLYKKKKINFQKVRTFNLDEYSGLSSKDKQSYRNYMNKNLFDHVNISKSNINFLNGKAVDYVKECKRYENKIKKNPIDLQILGIGVNGHIAFNEPGSGFDSRTRRVKLSENTRRVNSDHFYSLSKVPKYALTMGIGTIMEAKKIILVATGREKSKSIKKVINGKITEKVPATILNQHKNVSFVVDQRSVSGIKNFKNEF